MTHRDERAVAAYVERFGNVLTEAGMPRLAARVFAQLLADDDGRMTALELTEALDVSPAAVSGAVQYLTRTHLIGRERERGSRRDLYVVHLDAWHEAMLSRDRLLGQMQASVRSGLEAVGGLGSAAGRRLALSALFLEHVAAETAGMHASWERRRAQICADWPADP